MVKGVIARLFEMLNEGVMTDVTFIVQGTEIKAHRTVVGSCTGPLRDLLETKSEKIEINDVPPQTFKAVLQYLYTDACDVNPQNIIELMYAAKKFELEDLGNHCVKTDLLKPTVTNVVALTAQALYFDAKELLAMCKECFKTNTSKIINSDKFPEISNEVLVEFCGMEHTASSEMELFSACIRWAIHERKRQGLEKTDQSLKAVLGDAFAKIRFAEMSILDFTQFVVPMNILSPEDVCQIITKIHERGNIDDKQTDAEYWSEIMEVRVKDYRRNRSDSILHLPRTTRISQLKKMKIFNGGQEAYPPDKFTVSLCDDFDGIKEIEVDDHLIYRDLSFSKKLIINSITITVKAEDKNWEYPLTIETKDLWKKDFNVIKGHVYGLEDIHPDDIRRVEFYDKIPGGTAIVHLRTVDIRPVSSLNLEV